MPADHDTRPTTTSMRSIREPGASPRGASPADGSPLGGVHLDPPARPQRPVSAAAPRAPRARPDPNPLRLMLGLAGLATAAAFTTAMLPSVTPVADAAVAQAPSDQAPVDQVPATADQPAPSVLHVKKYVTLQAGQTAPPQATVVVRPTPTPKVKVKVVVKTRQSGKP